MGRFLIAIVLLVGCGTKAEPPPKQEVNEGELYARKARAVFTAVITDFHDDVAAGRIDAAYARLAPMYRAKVPIDAFAGVAKHPALAAGVTFKMDSSTMTNGLAKVSGYLAGPGGPAMVEMRCTSIDGAWRISGLFVDGAAVLP